MPGRHRGAGAGAPRRRHRVLPPGASTRRRTPPAPL